MELFVTDADVRDLKGQLDSARGLLRLRLMVQLAWGLRQRDSHAALAWVAQAKSALAELAEQDLPEPEAAAITARLALVEGETSWLFAQLDRAQQLADQALAVFQAQDHALACADAHWLCAAIAIDRGQHALRDQHLQAVIACAHRGGDTLRVALAEANLARWDVFRDLPGALLRWGKRFPADFSERAVPPALAAAVHDYLAVAASHASDFAQAAKHYLLAREAALQSGQIRLAIIASTNLGEDFTKLNDHQTSLDWMQKGLTLARPTGWPRNVGACLMHTAETMRRMGQLEMAQELLAEALEILTPLFEARSYAVALLYLGNLALDRRDYPLARDSFQRLQERGDVLHQYDFQIDARRGLAHAFNYLQQPERALEVAQQAWQLAREKDDAYRQIDVLTVLADIHARHALPLPEAAAGQPASLYYLQQALEISLTIEGYTLPGDLLDAIGREYAQLGDYAKAYEMALQANAARERTQGQMATNRALALRMQQQTERAEAEGEHLRQLAAAEAKRAEVLQRTSETLRHLSAIGQEITGHLDAGDVFGVLNRHVHGLLDATSFSVFLLDESGQFLERAFGIEAGQRLPERRLSVDQAHSNAARCARERREIVMQHQPGTNNPYQNPGTLLTLSALFGPLLVGERLLGVMTVQAPHVDAYGEREQLIFRTLCAYGAIALDNAATYRELKATLGALNQTQQQLAEAARIQTRLVEEKMQVEQLARQRAEEATRQKSDFLANMSHEIRTPMNAVIGMAHLALRTELSPKQQDYINKIHRSGLSLLGILNDILDFSKIEAGKLDIEAAPFFLDDVLANVASVTCQKAADKGLEYLFTVPHAIPRYLVGDALRLSQVLINLVNNAIKFTETGEIELACQRLPDAIAQVGEGGAAVRLQFTVRDTGIGLSPAQQAQLFQAFAQADVATSRKYGGSGLGLSISRHLVQLMGGDISLTSGVGQGANFGFVLRLPLATSGSSGPGLALPYDDARILVVDDHPQAAANLVDALQARPLRVHAVQDAKDALAALLAADAEHDPYRLVLCDWQLQDMAGLDLLRKIIANQRLAWQPALVLLSAFGQEAVQEEAERIGVHGILYKPLNQSQLLDMLNAVLAGEQQAGVVGSPTIRFRNTRVLLAEDNDINSQIALELLRVVGIEAEPVADGLQALERLQQAGPNAYQLILMDLEMPELDGHQAARRIRADARFNAVPIIAMTAHAIKEIRASCLADGMQDFLTKPVNPERLYRTLERWLDPALREPQASAAEPAAPRAPVGSSVHGIDYHLGLSHVAGNSVLYRQLLERFCQSQQTAVAELRRYCQAGERQAAVRAVHTLRGVAANIGAYELTHAAKVVERSLLDPASSPGNAAQERHLQTLEQVMLGTLAELRHYLQTHQAAPEGADAAPEIDCRKGLPHLITLLQESDAGATECFVTMRAQLAPKLGAERMARLTRAIHEYEFDVALECLRDLPTRCITPETDQPTPVPDEPAR